MKVFLRKKNENWIDITKNVNKPIFMNIAEDGTYNSIKLTARFQVGYFPFDVSKPIPPKYELKITENENDEQERINTFYFITTNTNTSRLRKDIKSELGQTITTGIYEHEINGFERLYLLEDYYMPDYTVTQPKTKFFDVYRIYQGYRVELGQIFEQDGNNKTLWQGTSISYNARNNNGEVDKDYIDGKHIIILDNINEISYNIDFGILMQKTAPSYFISTSFLGIESKKKIVAGLTTDGISLFDLKTRKRYYDENDVLIETENIITKIKYNGGEVQIAYKGLFGKTFDYIKGFPPIQENITTINIGKKVNAKYVKVDFEIINAREEGNFLETIKIQDPLLLTANIENVESTNVLTKINELNISITSSEMLKPFEEKYITLYEFLEKATHDYNFNKRDKIILSEDLLVPLSIPMKESEWVDYNYKEIITRLFEYAKIRPYLTHDNILTYFKTRKISRFIDLEKGQEKETEHIGEDYFDKVVSTTKNLVSEKDFIREIVPINSTDTEFTKIDNTNVGFQLSNDIYFVSKAILKAFDKNNEPIEFDIPKKDSGTTKVKSNIGIDGYWDITSRFFEKGIYESFPDVRYDLKNDQAKTGFDVNVLREKFDLYSRGNTIHYESGSNIIGGLMNQAPSIPQMSWALTENSNDAEYSIIETLIMLAYQEAGVPSKNLGQTEIKLADIMNFELDITYAPIYKELTTKHMSNMEERRGLLFEKKFNMNDKTVSYGDSATVLRKEMESKGNVKDIYVEHFNKIEDIIQTNSIVNDNLYVSNAIISIDKYIKVEYLLQKNFILQSEDIRLPVSFEPYNIPYEFVNREIMIDNHLMFNIKNTTRYGGDDYSANEDFLREVFVNGIDKVIYANLKLDFEKKYLMRLGKLTSGFSMILTGKFLDNYSAGTQRWFGSDGVGDYFYSQPLRYTDSYGRVERVENVIIGYDNQKNYIKNYDLLKFPYGDSVNGFDNLLFNEIDLAIRKDAREGLSLVHTSYLESEVNDIKFYNFLPITQIGWLLDDIEFVDDLSLQDIRYVEYDEAISGITITPLNNPNHYMVTVTLDGFTEADFPNGITLFNNGELVGLIKNAEWSENSFNFYINSTRYGYDEEELVNMWLKASFKVDGLLNYVILKTKTVSVFGSLGVQGKTTYIPIKTKAAKLDGSLETDGKTQYVAIKTKQRSIFGRVEIDGEADYTAAKLDLKRKYVDGEFGISGFVNYKARNKNLLALSKVGGSSQVLGELDIELDKTYGITESFDGNLEVIGELDYTPATLKIIQNQYTGTIGIIGGEIDYTPATLDYKEISKIDGDMSVVGNVNYTPATLDIKQKDVNGELEIGGTLKYQKREADLFIINKLSNSLEVIGELDLDPDITYGITESFDGELSVSGSIDYTPATLEEIEINKILGYIQAEGEVDYTPEIIHFKEQGLDGDIGLRGKTVYNISPLSFGEKDLDGELEISGYMSYDVREADLFVMNKTDGELEIGGSLKYSEDKTYGKTYYLSNNLKVKGAVNYIAENFEIKTINKLSNNLKVKGDVNYNTTKGTLLTKSFNGGIMLLGSINKTAIKNPAPPPKTTTPTILSGVCIDKFDGYTSNKYLRVEVKNNDASSVTMYINGSNRGTVASNSSKVVDILDNTLPKSVTVSAYAKATNKTSSNTVSKTFRITFCIAGL